MFYEASKSAWVQKGGTLSDKSAQKEYGLTKDEIIEAINNGKLQYRVNVIYGNPYFKLVRSEVEALVNEKYGSNYLEEKKIKKELSEVNKELRMLKKQIVFLEQRKTDLLACLDK